MFSHSEVFDHFTDGHSLGIILLSANLTRSDDEPTFKLSFPRLCVTLCYIKHQTYSTDIIEATNLNTIVLLPYCSKHFSEDNQVKGN